MDQGFFRIPALAGLCLSATIAVSACHDARSDPMAVLLAEDTQRALLTDPRLPSLARLSEEAGAEARLSGPADLWSESWEHPPEEGRELRRRAYDESAGALAGALGRASVEATVASVGDALKAAASLDPVSLGERVLDHLERAERLHEAALAALGEGRDAEALSRGLHAADVLREVGPETVARTLLFEAEGALERVRIPEDGPPSIDVARGQRLVRGARQALEAGDHAMAIRRAYYACQVLGVQPG